MKKKTKSCSRFSFAGSDKNVNGEYLKLTHVREIGGKWVFAGVIMFLTWLAYIAVLLNWEMFTPDKILASESLAVRYGRYSAFLPWIVPISVICVLGLPLLWGMVLLSKWPGGKGWTAWNSAFARWYGKWRQGQKGKFREAGLFYFDAYERHPMEVVFYDDGIQIPLPDGDRDVSYSEINKVFRRRDLFVVRAIQNDEPWDVIVDLGELAKDEKKDFLAFVDSKKGEFIRLFDYTEPWNPEPE